MMLEFFEVWLSPYSKIRNPLTRPMLSLDDVLITSNHEA
jgi:hypothetical protein